MIQAFVLGLYVAIFDMLSVYFSQAYGFQRITAGGFNANQIAVYLGVGIPLAWYLVLNYKKNIFYWFNIACIPLAIFCLILTGSRTGFVVGLVGLSIIPLTYHLLNIRGQMTVIASVVVITIFLAFSYEQIYPRIEHNIERIMETQEQIEGGHISGRGSIWRAGMTVFSDRAVLGVGSGAFSMSIVEVHGKRMSAHNTYISFLVEGGIIGFLLFLGVLFIAFIPIIYFHYSEKIAFLIIFTTILVAMIPLHLDVDKVLWFTIASFQSGGYLTFRNGGFNVVVR